MNIDETSDEQKSVALAKAMGIVEPGPVTGTPWAVIGPVIKLDVLNLYDPANRALAWRVLIWASDQSFYYAGWKSLEKTWMLLWDEPPADAQRLWLDKILELALEAGLEVAVP